MAPILLQVLVLGVLAAAADDVPLTWYWSSRAALPCSLPDSGRGSGRAQARRPLPLQGSEPEPPLYSWRRDGANYTHGILGNGTLEVRRREGGDDGVYQCAAARARGVVLGYPIRLQTAHLDKFSKHPENTTARHGQPAVLSCVINSAPPATVSWLRNEEDLPADDRYYLLKNQLLITGVRQSDAGVYRCIATNPYLNKTRSSHAGRLHVAYAEPRDAELLPTFEDQQLMVPQGGDVVLPCPVAGWPRPEPDVVWELNSSGHVSKLHETSQVLVVTDVQEHHEGLYTCRVPGRPDLEKWYNVTVTRPVNITLPPVSKEVMRAGTVRLNCTATGNPAPEVTWYKDGAPLKLTGTITLKAAFTDKGRIELVINSITSTDAGVYQCFASNNVTMASAWATLTVSGATAAAPQDIACAPVGAREVAVRWAPVDAQVLAYTIHTTPQEPDGHKTPLGPPVQDTHSVVPVAEALMPYRFQVRAYIRAKQPKAGGPITDFSDFVVCQGQGVPINLTKLNKSVVVSWQNFARQTPGVVQWILESRMANRVDDVINVTLPGPTTNYTLDLPEEGDLQVRLLGTRSLPWLRQELRQVPWHSLDLTSGDLRATPRELQATHVGARWVTVQWVTDELAPLKYKFLVCATPPGGDEICQSSETNSATIENLQPNTDYDVRVETQIQDLDSAEAVLPLPVSTLAEEANSISYKFVNDTAVRVTWSAPPGRYTVRRRQLLPRPHGDWTSQDTDSNIILLTGIDPNAETHVEVTSHETKATSQKIVIPPNQKEIEAKDLSYVYTGSGITVSWAGAGARVVRFAQNITLPIERWRVINVTETHVKLTGLDPQLVTYVTVTSHGAGGHVLTVPARPAAAPHLTLGVGIGCAVCVLLLLAALAVLLWRRRKMAASPVRSRRRNASPVEGHEGESSEMKSIGGRLANGGAAGEPLLNGHVHITENPTSKTPNGKMKKARYEPFDVSRHDADTTAETVLEPDTSASFTLLDTSRRADHSFNKLPDDNMNSELARAEFALDNSNVHPTLQPNG